jgi:N-acetylglucosamine repressor
MSRPRSKSSSRPRRVSSGAGSASVEPPDPPVLAGDASVARRIRPALLRQLNERAVFEVVRRSGPITRAELTRQSGITAPTASKVVGKLLEAGFLEEVDGNGHDEDHAGERPSASASTGAANAIRAGRPSKVYRLATSSVQVLGATIDVRRCSVLASGLDGHIQPEHVLEFATPATYVKLIDALAERARALLRRPVTTLGLGISTPGEVDVKNQRVLLSPNLHITDGQSPARDLHERLGIETVMFHETVGTCLAEHAYGAARGLSDFVMVGVYEGFGVSMVSGGRLIQGHEHMAGEMGHVTIDLNGQRCGCGNHGCLETVATDAAFARAISRRLGRRMEVEETIALAREGKLDAQSELSRTLEYLGVGVAALVNIFNPEAVLVCARMLDASPDAFDELKGIVQRRALAPLLRNCRLVRAEGNTRQGAIASIIHHLTHALGPVLD